MKAGAIRINRMTVRVRGVAPAEARARGASIAREVAAAVARQAAATQGTAKRIDRLTLGAASALEQQIQRQWTER
jgi:hypothetical protein